MGMGEHDVLDGSVCRCGRYPGSLGVTVMSIFQGLSQSVMG